MADNSSPSKLQKRNPRRLNKVPLVAFSLVLAGFAGIVVYTAEQRSKEEQQRIHAAAEKRSEPARPPANMFAARASEPAPLPLPPPPSNGPPPPPQPAPPLMMPDPRIQAWHAYYAEMGKLAAARAEAQSKAMTSGTDVSGNGPSEGGGKVAGGGAGGLTAGLGGQSEDAPVAGVDAGAQAEKRAFLNRKGDTLGLNEDLRAVKHNAKPDTIMEGTPIPAVMLGRMNSDMPGMVVGQVLANVHESMDRNGHPDVLIPYGSKLVGTYDNSVSNGQTRIGVVWNRIIFPDTSSLQIGSMEGADQAGTAGFRDEVNTHFWEKFGSAMLISIAGTGAQLAQPQQSAFSGYSPSSVAAGQMTAQFQQLGQEYARAGMSVPNTLEIRPGYRFVVMVSKDIHLPPYVDQRDAEPQLAGPVMR